MRYRTLGKTGWKVSEIGYGGWGIGAKWWGATDDAESIKALQAAWKAGINFFDTAFVYGDGHSEQIMAKALPREALIATKIPPKNNQWPPTPKTAVQEAFPADWIRSCTERSLKYLKRDAVDLTQFHVWTDAWINEDEWKTAVRRLKEEGKIRAFGVSINDHDPDSALQLVASGLVDTVQVIYNIFDQSPAKALLPLCLKHKVGVIVRVPFDEGGLTGKLTVDTTFEPEDFRSKYFQGDHLRQTVERVDRLKPLLNGEAQTMPELALKFVLAHEAVSTVIAGMRRPTHVMENAAVADRPGLSKQTVEKLHQHAWPRNFYDWWDD